MVLAAYGSYDSTSQSIPEDISVILVKASFDTSGGASLYWNDDRIQYVEGFGIDLFTSGEIFLKPTCQQKIGIVFDKGIESDPADLVTQRDEPGECHEQQGSQESRVHEGLQAALRLKWKIVIPAKIFSATAR